MEIILEKPKGSINGISFWTLGWKVKIGEKTYGRLWPIEAPTKKERQWLKEYIKSLDKAQTSI